MVRGALADRGRGAGGEHPGALAKAFEPHSFVPFRGESSNFQALISQIGITRADLQLDGDFIYKCLQDLASHGLIEPLDFHSGRLALRRKRIAGSAIGSIEETREMLQFCGEHNITADVELIKPDEINGAWERVQKSDVKYRFVIDLQPTR